jgi:exonuclease SbcD
MNRKFIVSGDWHFKGINPRARLDNYQEAITRKIHEVFELAVLHKAEAIIVPGDLFDSPSTTLSTITDLAALLQLAPCKILAIPGNHDIWASNPGSKYRTPYGLLARLGLIWDLSDRPYETVTEENDEMFNVFDDVCVTGHGYNNETDTEAGKGQFCPPLPGASCYRDKIHVVHSMLMDHAPGFEMRHTLISQVETTAKVVVAGHEHLGFGIFRRDDEVLFINPGALCRMSASQAEIERQVQVALLIIDDDGNTSAELIPLRSALQGREVLSREHLEAENDRQERMEKFLGLLASEGESKFLEVRDIIEDISARKNIPEAVKSEALKRIDAAREELAKTGVGA